MAAALAALGVGAAACSSSSHHGAAPTTASVGSTSTSVVLARDRRPVLRCPQYAPEVVPKAQVPGTTVRFVPGVPVELRACRYHGLNVAESHGSLASSASLPAASIAAPLNAARSVGNVIPGCPNGEGQIALLLFGYRTGDALVVRVDLGGCRFASNGDGLVFAPAAVTTRLAAALGHDPLP